jgi:hypothetical protein
VPSYKVKPGNTVSQGKIGAREKRESRRIGAGESVELDEKDAFDIMHALEDPPTTKPGDEELPGEVIESLMNNPEHPAAGIELFWKSQPDASVRTEANKSELEKELEPMRQQTEAKDKAAASKGRQPGMPAKPSIPGEGTARPGPVVPVGTRPSPEKK